MRRLLPQLLALFTAALSSGTAGATNLTLSWVAPTQYTDGSNIAAGTAITYNVYGAIQGQPLQQLATALATTTTVRANVDPGVRCYAVTAVITGIESAQTPQVCATVAPPTPAPPTNLTVTVSVSANTVYTLIKETDRFVFLPVGTVPAGTKCDPSQNANGYYAVPRSAVTFTGNVQPPIVVASCS